MPAGSSVNCSGLENREHPFCMCMHLPGLPEISRNLTVDCMVFWMGVWKLWQPDINAAVLPGATMCVPGMIRKHPNENRGKLTMLLNIP